MKFIATILMSLTLMGCGTFDMKLIENRVVCTAAKDEAHILSKWGMFGITGKVADADRAVVCK
jgi:hypothetical protein